MVSPLITAMNKIGAAGPNERNGFDILLSVIFGIGATNPDYSLIILTIKLHLNIGKIKTPNFGCSYPDVKSGGVYLRELTLFGSRFATQYPSHIHTFRCAQV